MKFLIIEWLVIYLGMQACASRDNNKQFVREDFVACTDLKDSYSVIKSQFKANQAFTIARISERDKTRLLNRFQYIIADSLHPHWEGVGFSLFDLDTGYVYYKTGYEVKGRPAQHAYEYDGYYILGVSKTKNEVVFCENFPELPPF